MTQRAAIQTPRSEKIWLADDAKRAVETAIARVEAKTSAEIVVTLRKSSGSYRQADLAFGSVASFVALLVYVYFPATFTDDLVPPAIALLFVSSAFFCSQLPPLRRLFVRRSTLAENARRAALVEFHDRRIATTRGRTGILIYISLFERAVEVVPDIGIEVAALGEEWTTALAELRGKSSVDSFVDALESLGPILGRCLPRASDDVNELADRVAS